MTIQLTPHFSLEELTKTDTGLDNTPSPSVTEVLRTTAFYMEKVRDLLKVAINVNSGYRSPKVNKAVGGSNHSAHMLGYAVDFTAKGISPLDVCKIISGSGLKFDQLIYEKFWTHISFDPKMRGELLTKDGNGFIKGIV